VTEHRLRRLDTDEEFALVGQMFIGRDESCDITLEDAEISRRHAVISVTEEGVVIADNDSTNGLLVGGRSSRRATLAHGQVVQIGEIRLCFLERGRSDDPTIAMPRSESSASFVVDQGVGEDTAFRGGYAPLPGDESDEIRSIASQAAAEPADRALLQKLIAHHDITATKTLAVLMPLGHERGGLRSLHLADAPAWTLGRCADCDLVFDDPSISLEHARLTHGDGGWTLEDLNSTNGTRCRGITTRRSELAPGDVIQLGNLVLLFDVIDA
jgi:pSer/pThr/pTyr-binding forkhead associated (FHA) protein